jgi:hypothetical protein
MEILNRHLYRTSSAEDQDKPAIIIPFSKLLQVINAHEDQRDWLDIGSKKRRYGEEEEVEEGAVANQIDRFLKKPRI